MNKIKLIISLLIIIFLSFSTFSYYTNISKWLDLQQISFADGEGQQRLSEDFILNGCGSGTILDTLTGLCWDRNLNRFGQIKWATNNSFIEPIWDGSNYQWPLERSENDYPTFKNCNDLTLGDNNDWRVPNYFELLTILDESSSGCTPLSNLGFLNCQSNNYWTSTQRNSNYNHSNYVILTYGSSTFGEKINEYFVVCVRRD